MISAQTLRLSRGKTASHFSDHAPGNREGVSQVTVLPRAISHIASHRIVAAPDHLVLNQTIGLRDTFAKEVGNSQALRPPPVFPLQFRAMLEGRRPT